MFLPTNEHAQLPVASNTQDDPPRACAGGMCVEHLSFLVQLRPTSSLKSGTAAAAVMHLKTF